MVQRIDGQNYAPKGKACKVCGKGEFPVGVVGLDHGHIYGMCNALSEAGADIDCVYDGDQAKVDRFLKDFPQARQARSAEEIYLDPKITLVATAAIPSERADISVMALLSGKHVFSDKPGCTTMAQLQRLRKTVRETGLRYGIYFSERLHVEAATYADRLIAEGKIGKVVQTIVLGPHRLNRETRPDWFFQKDKYGGILTDIGCHQIEQILHYCGAQDARLVTSHVGNYTISDIPEFEDFGDASFVCDNGTSGYFRVDWFTPKGLRAWGDGRTVILGTEGYIELRKYIDVARADKGNMVYYANREGEFVVDANNTLGFPFFGAFIKDCLNHQELSIAQEYTFKVMELAIQAENNAVRLPQGEEKR